MAIKRELKLIKRKTRETLPIKQVVRKGRYLLIKWEVHKETTAVRYTVSISARIVTKANKRNRIKRLLTEWINQNHSKIRPGTIMHVGLVGIAEEGELIRELREIIGININA